jgi:hypothetical protein
MIVTPAMNLVLHVTRFEPLVAKHARYCAIPVPLSPTHMMIVQIVGRHDELRTKDQAGADCIEFATQLVIPPVHRV